MSGLFQLFSKLDFSELLQLFLIVDPIGNLPIFISLLRPVPAKRRSWVIVRENLIALLVFTIFLISGRSILQLLDISSESLSVAGGVILFIVAFRMIFPKDDASRTIPQADKEPFIVPLAIPSLAGPAAIGKVVLASAQLYRRGILASLLPLILVTAASTTIWLFALPLYRIFGSRMLQAFERVSGVVLIALAVEMVLGPLRLI